MQTRKQEVSFTNLPPVAGGVADGEEDRFLFAFGLFEGSVGPGHPMDGIVGVLLQVGGFFVDEGVGLSILMVRGHGEPPLSFVLILVNYSIVEYKISVTGGRWFALRNGGSSGS